MSDTVSTSSALSVKPGFFDGNHISTEMPKMAAWSEPDVITAGSMPFRSIAQSATTASALGSREFKKRFQELAKKWRTETMLLSSLREKFLHSAYQQIIGMGPRALPLIIEELRKRPAYWFWAVDSISGERPSDLPRAKTFNEIVAVYLKWGHAKGW